MFKPSITQFQIFPRLPERLTSLVDLASNLQWSWDHDVIALFRRMDLDLWEQTRHNPVLMLGTIKQERIEELARDDSFLSHMDRAVVGMQAYQMAKSWYHKAHGDDETPFIAYFSMEFGLTECVPIYSGGLGVLAGDHLKSASDLGLPLVAVGLLYQQGYFRQYLNLDGWQQERYPDNDFYNMPMTLERDADGNARMIDVALPGRTLYAQIWRVQVGRVPLYLLDANLPRNSPDDRSITHQLYGGNKEMRIKQEILLGIGGIRALKAFGITPDVCHMNEGHSAFLALERVRQIMAGDGCTFYDALTTTRAGNVFTTHTPVPAGIDVFDRKLVDKYFGDYARELGVPMNELMEMGRAENMKEKYGLNMALFAIHASTYVNAVSKLHGRVARQMWSYNWPQVPENEIPISHVTNGIHLHSWVSLEMADLLERYLGVAWKYEIASEKLWEHIDEIPDAELWMTHERRRQRLVAFARRRLVEQYQQRGLPDSEIAHAKEVLLPSALTLGFARRFATYKRATLLLRDPERFCRLLTNEERPVQFVFAGKAHPLDEGGKQLIRELVHFAREAGVRHRLIFLEDYDISVARYLVQGVDVWVNTPRRPHEASGTSGMKVLANGGLNFSILDGWWDEAYSREVGWAIGYGEEYSDTELQDKIESEELYNILEREIVPLFYTLSSGNLPREWIAMMKASMKSLGPRFNTDRMVQEYADKFYIPARASFQRLYHDDMAHGKQLTAWCEKVKANWNNVAIRNVEADTSKKLYVGQSIPVKATVRLGALTDEDVSVQLYLGRISPQRDVENGRALSMKCVSQDDNGVYTYECAVRCETSGLQGFAVRVLPKHEDLVDPYSLKLICWK